MKSRTLIGLALLVAAPSLPVSAQVLPLGRVPHRGQVQPASCQSCTEPNVGFYGFSTGHHVHGGTVWGTDCSVRPGLFPPCPSPCQTTLLGELVYDVKTAVDGTLSTVFGCLFGDPYGCRGAGTCGEPMWDTCGTACGGAWQRGWRRVWRRIGRGVRRTVRAETTACLRPPPCNRHRPRMTTTWILSATTPCRRPPYSRYQVRPRGDHYCRIRAGRRRHRVVVPSRLVTCLMSNPCQRRMA